MNLSKPNAAVVGRRLRRYLGALLALGFGAAWWRFVPPAKAAAAVPVHVVAHKVNAVPALITTTPHAPTNRLPRVPRPVKPHPHRHVVVVPPPVPPPVVVDVDVTPVVAPVVAPVVDPVVVPEPVDDPIEIPHIRTRSS